MITRLLCALTASVLLEMPVYTQVPVPYATGPWPIAAIEVTGNQRYSAAVVTRISGLSLTQRVTIAQLDETLKRMAATGLFAEVGYQYALRDAAAGAMTITFEIKEPAWTMPVVFDNFLSFSDGELITAVEKDVPTFDGTVPVSDAVIQRVQHSLESYLTSKGATAPVRMDRRLDARTKSVVYVFRADGPALRICAATVTGVSKVMTAPVAAAIQTLKDLDYSRVRTAAAARDVLRPVYEEVGLLGVEIGDPIPTRDNSCDGVNLAVPVTEGSVYTWGPVEWRGVSSPRTADLARALALPPDTPARRPVFVLETRRIPVLREFRKLGHIKATVNLTHQVDHDARRVGITIEVNEGPQFRMGSVEFVNLPEDDQEALVAKWALRRGDVYDESYVLTFIRDHVTPLARRLMLPNLQPAITTPPGTTVVNIRIDFRG